jgi:hypothetical protein
MLDVERSYANLKSSIIPNAIPLLERRPLSGSGG